MAYADVALEVAPREEIVLVDVEATYQGVGVLVANKEDDAVVSIECATHRKAQFWTIGGGLGVEVVAIV